MEKVCFKCGLKKSISEYYKHPKMSDGHLNKCKDCTKNDSRNRFNELKHNDEWVESEKIRGREKYYRLNYNDAQKSKPKNNDRITSKYSIKYPEKYAARIACQRVVKQFKDNHMHHWSYNKEHYKDVIELSPAIHAFLHRYIQYDQERMMYRTSCKMGGFDSGELLDSKERHIEFLECAKTFKKVRYN